MPQPKPSRSYGGSRPIHSAGRRLGAWRHEPARDAPPAADAGNSQRGAWSAVAVILAALGTAGVVAAKTAVEPKPLSMIGGAVDQHTCPTLVGKTVLATNQIDFNLRAAEALQYGCLEFAEGSLAVHHNALFGHITQVVKVGIDKR